MMDMFRENDFDAFAFVLSSVMVCLLLCGFIIYFIFFYRKKQSQNEQEKKSLQIKYNQALLESQIEIQEQLLQQVSSEIHDNVGQVAALIKLNLVSFPKDLSPEAADKLAQTRELMKKLMADLKSLSISLNTSYLEEEGLFKVLELEADKLNRTGAIKASFSATGGPVSLDVGKEIFLYRMVQELISNVVKHAEASEMAITLDANEREISFVVFDNGKGFDVAMVMNQSMKQQSTGLRGLQKRADLIGAELDIKSNPGEGTTIKICLPLVTNHERGN